MMRKFTIETVVFVCGASIMIMELVGSRVLSPYLGASLFTWTSLIGIVLASLSLGYWWGGRVADRYPSERLMAWIIFGGALWVGLVAFAESHILAFIVNAFPDTRVAATLASIALFGVPGVLLGMVAPFAVRLKVKKLEQAGSAAGTLYAISTMGSIVGTFLAGFCLIPLLGTQRILFCIAFVLMGASFFTFFRTGLLIRTGLVVLLALSALLRNAEGRTLAQDGWLDTDTSYSRIMIYDYKTAYDTLTVRAMRIGVKASGARFLENDDLVFAYTKFYRLAGHFRPAIQKALMIGGGCYSYPRVFLKDFPEASMDAVEIDPGVTDLARRYFGLEDNPRLRIFHEDGRIFLNRTEEKYDVVFLDAFKSLYALPFHLTTLETMEAVDKALLPDGIVMANLITALEGEGSEFLRAAVATFKAVFPQVYLFPVRVPDKGEEVQNVMLVALKGKKVPQFYSRDPAMNKMLHHIWVNEVPQDLPMLTDRYAPVERYTLKIVPTTASVVNPESIRKGFDQNA